MEIKKDETKETSCASDQDEDMMTAARHFCKSLDSLQSSALITLTGLIQILNSTPV
jgi:hypothetical protein